MIYLDYSAHTSPDPRVLERFLSVAREYPGNANAPHAEGESARALLDSSISAIASFFGAEPEEVIMTSGATEGNNMAIKGSLRLLRHVGRHAVTTPVEHASVTAPLSACREEGWRVDVVSMDDGGRVRMDELRAALSPDTVLVSCCMVDSELGIVQDVDAIADIVHEKPNRFLHVDATQAVGKIPVRFGKADFMTLSAHKFYGVGGVGVLLKKRGAPMEPLLHGGRGQSDSRSGTAPLELIASTAEALGLCAEEADARFRQVSALNARLRAALACMQGLRINSPQGAIPHILNLGIVGLRAEGAVSFLSECGICLSAKSACSYPGTPSKPVYAMSRDKRRARESFRISLSHLTTDAEIAMLTEKIAEMIEWNAGKR